MPAAAATSTAGSTGNAAVKSPPACHTNSIRLIRPPPATPASKRPASTRSVSQNGIPSTATAPKAQSACRRPVAAGARTKTPCEASTSAPYGCVATVARIASAQSAHARLSPRSSARSSVR